MRSVIELRVTVDYSLYERASLLIQGAGAKLAEPEFTDRVALRWQMPEGTEGPLLEQLQPECLIIDLASRPGGVDFEAAGTDPGRGKCERFQAVLRPVLNGLDGRKRKFG